MFVAAFGRYPGTVKHLLPDNVSKISSILGRAYLIVLLFNCLQSMHILRLPSCFLTKTTFDAHGECDGLIIPVAANCSKCNLTSSVIAGEILLCLCLKGIS